MNLLNHFYAKLFYQPNTALRYNPPNSKVTDLVAESADVGGDARDDANLVDVVVVGGESELAGLSVLLVVKVVPVVVHHNEVDHLKSNRSRSQYET